MWRLDYRFLINTGFKEELHTRTLHQIKSGQRNPEVKVIRTSKTHGNNETYTHNILDVKYEREGTVLEIYPYVEG